MPRDYRVFLEDILEAIANISQFIGAMSRAEFDAVNVDHPRRCPRLGSHRRSGQVHPNRGARPPS